MTSQIKNKIAKNFYKVLHTSGDVKNYSEVFQHVNVLQSKSNERGWIVNVSKNEKLSANTDVIEKCQKSLLEDETIRNISVVNKEDDILFKVELDDKNFVKDVLESSPTELNYKGFSKKVIFEFSSPNIAKPFHVGHLRSTLIGNSLANVKKKLGDEVVKINYLGDWGTQFGLVQVGLNLEKPTESEFEKDPLTVLLKAYVKGNLEANKNKEVFQKAKNIFYDLEFENKDLATTWSRIRNLTMNGLNTTYDRLGISFDEYAWESDYRRQRANGILDRLKRKNLLIQDENGALVVMLDDKPIPLIKKDNTTLYLIRDLMALEDRRSKHKFDEMYYVVDHSQSEHFNALFTIGSKLGLDHDVELHHVKFGRILGMSTRSGQVTLLCDILDESQNKVFEIQKKSPKTKIKLDNKEVADILGVSAVIINDLKRRRTKDYTFSWDDIQLMESNGIALQYCHCRLCSLFSKAPVDPATVCDPNVLQEPEALHLVQTIAQYEEKLLLANSRLEPCLITMYLFDLVKAINAAHFKLKVLKVDDHTAKQRLLLFMKSKEVLNDGMKLLGLKPLTQM